MQIINVSNLSLNPGSKIESQAWLDMRANQNEIFAHSGERIPGLPGAFMTTSTTTTQTNQEPGGLDLSTWNPVLVGDRPLNTGMSFTAHAFGSNFRLFLRFVQVSNFSSLEIYQATIIADSGTSGWSSSDFVIPTIPSGYRLTINAMSRAHAAGTARIEQFFLREKIATEAEIP